MVILGVEALKVMIARLIISGDSFSVSVRWEVFPISSLVLMISKISLFRKKTTLTRRTWCSLW